MGTKENLLKRAMKTAELEINSLPKRIKKADEKGETSIIISYFSGNETNGNVFAMIKEWAVGQGYSTATMWRITSKTEGYYDDNLIISWEQ